MEPKPGTPPFGNAVIKWRRCATDGGYNGHQNGRHYRITPWPWRLFVDGVQVDPCGNGCFHLLRTAKAKALAIARGEG